MQFTKLGERLIIATNKIAIKNRFTRNQRLKIAAPGSG